MVMSLLETGRLPMTVFTMSLWTRNPTPCSCLSYFLLKKILCPHTVVVSPKFFHLILQSPRMFHLYLSISCVISWSFPAAISVLVFHVPMVMSSLPWIFDDAPVQCFTSPSWCKAEGMVLVNLGGGRASIAWVLVSLMTIQGQGTTWQSPSLSRSSTWNLSFSWNTSTHLALVFELLTLSGQVTCI